MSLVGFPNQIKVVLGDVFVGWNANDLKTGDEIILTKNGSQWTEDGTNTPSVTNRLKVFFNSAQYNGGKAYVYVQQASYSNATFGTWDDASQTTPIKQYVQGQGGRAIQNTYTFNAINNPNGAIDLLTGGSSGTLQQKVQIFSTAANLTNGGYWNYTWGPFPGSYTPVNFFGDSNANNAWDLVFDSMEEYVPAGATYESTTTFDAGQTVAYGTSSSPITGSVATTMSPVTGISSVQVDSIELQGNTTYFGAVSTNVSLPATVLNGQSVNFSVVYNNTRLHVSTESQNVSAVATTSNPQLSSTYTNSVSASLTGSVVWPSTISTISALGDAGAPSAVQNFTVTPGQLRTNMTWTNPTNSDLSAVRVNFAVGTVAPADEGSGTQLYQGLSTSVEHTGLSGNTAYAYSIFATDNVGNWTSLTSATSGTATTYNASKYGLATKWPYLTDAEIRRKLVEEGII